MLAGHYRLVLGQDDDSGGSIRPAHFDGQLASDDEFPYKVELWNEAQSEVAVILAVAISVSLGYAAYYAATRDYPGRYITLRHDDRIVSRWNNPKSQ
jgi:hypothetical protein